MIAPFAFGHDREPVQLPNHHYAAHLPRTEPGLAAGVINAGAVKTDILRAAPCHMRAGAKVLGPVIFDPVRTSAHGVVEATRRDAHRHPCTEASPDASNNAPPISLNTTITQHVMGCGVHGLSRR
ncbi:hypothetical protein ACFV4T_18970 [Streptomyces sp. NPDC059755]|uniref:hypothetical protein n=1 Tax=Streptomyces sp. NPDC059755 TaxID=3346934 RepID=UPI0036635E72